MMAAMGRHQRMKTEKTRSLGSTVCVLNLVLFAMDVPSLVVAGADNSRRLLAVVALVDSAPFGISSISF